MNNLRTYRQLANLTQRELGEACGFKAAQARVGQYENGRTIPALSMCRHIISVLNEFGVECSLDDVFPPSADSDVA
ncbi:MAG: helix-turn-helix domain-containing protein [Saccharospirillum sp.]|nr:helix-turn-helix domain-containing protein [Saccharospirillum sp.]